LRPRRRIETYLSGPGLSRDHEKATGKRRSAEEIVSLGDQSLERYVERLARALASVINVLDPEVIVPGSDRVATRLARPVHGDSSGVRGAAWLWDRP
jgi:fructokinase